MFLIPSADGFGQFRFILSNLLLTIKRSVKKVGQIIDRFFVESRIEITIALERSQRAHAQLFRLGEIWTEAIKADPAQKVGRPKMRNDSYQFRHSLIIFCGLSGKTDQ